jgi:hypothetical protein
MKQSLLDELAGMDLNQAKNLIKRNHHDMYLVPEECVAINLLARPNTIIIFQENGKVKSAGPGDGCELENDIDNDLDIDTTGALEDGYDPEVEDNIHPED